MQKIDKEKFCVYFLRNCHPPKKVNNGQLNLQAQETLANTFITQPVLLTFNSTGSCQHWQLFYTFISTRKPNEMQ